MWSGDKDGLSTDAVHIDAGASLQVIEMDVAIFGNEKNHIVLGAYLSKTNLVTLHKAVHCYLKHHQNSAYSKCISEFSERSGTSTEIKLAFESVGFMCVTYTDDQP